VAVVAFPCWHERGSEARPGVGIGEIQPRSDVLGLEDEATWQGVHAVYFARSLRRKPSKHIAEWVEISQMQGRGRQSRSVPYFTRRGSLRVGALSL